MTFAARDCESPGVDMAKNDNLTRAKAKKNDEFYTQYDDIQREMNAYLEFDPDVFRGKTVLLPCDDPEWSHFTRFFATNFTRFGLKKLISTGYAPASRPHVPVPDPSPLERASPHFDAEKALHNGRIFVLEADANGDGAVDLRDLTWRYLEEDGDFRSAEVTALRDEADFVITNPPFSLFREFMAWVMEARKKFAVIASKNCITYKEIFPLIKGNMIWVGKTGFSTDLIFSAPFKIDPLAFPSSATRIVNGQVYLRSPSVWFTNIDHGRRHQPLSLMTMSDNLKFNRKMKGKTAYDRYDNYDAIDVPFTSAIPSDHDGPMGVPISFLDKYCPEQFEITGSFNAGSHGDDIGATKTQAVVNGKSILWNGPVINREPQYKRIMIRHIR